MRPSSSLLGASRLPLTPKRGNKDFYKGTRQSFVPGGGHRTGPPGKHVVGGKAKYRLLDERVRVFVGPGADVLASTSLRPYVATDVIRPSSLRLPSFSPSIPPPAVREDGTRPKLTQNDWTRFSKAYAKLSPVDRHKAIAQSRREWWEALQGAFPAPEQQPPESESPSTSGTPPSS